MNVRKSVKGVRIAAAIIDMIIIGIISGIVSSAITLPAIINWDPDKLSNATLIAGIVVAVIYFIYYTLLPYILNGATLGKLMVGIRVVSYDYKKPKFWQLLVRNIFLLNQLISIPYSRINVNNEQDMMNVNFTFGNLIIGAIFNILYIVIMIMILVTDEERGFHDLIGRTYVVDKRFNPDQLNYVNALERQGMDWAEFEEIPNTEPQMRIYQDDDIPFLQEDEQNKQ